MPKSARLLLAAGACSRRVGALATLPSSNVAAYASSGNVFVLRCDNRKVICVLPVHRAQVTTIALHPIQRLEGDQSCDKVLLLASAADGSVTTWEGVTQPSSTWRPLASWQAHEKQPCVAVSACNVSEKTAIVTAGMEGTLKLWTSDGNLDTWSCQAEAVIANAGDVLLECIAIRRVTPDCAIIAAGGTDSRVWIFDTAIVSPAQMQLTAVLTGHRDWVRGLSFSGDEASQCDHSDNATEEHGFFFASASKDGTARIWSVKKDIEGKVMDEFEIHTARVCATLRGARWSFTSVALLDEHTAAVHSVEFTKPSPISGLIPRLVTSSMDCTVAVWGRNIDDLWKCEARFGLISVGSAHALGFFGASFSSCNGNEVIGHNFAGALHSWKAETPVECDSIEGESKEYLAYYAPGGHFAAVTDLNWDAEGRYLLTCSADKTARIYAEAKVGNETRFVEWARPQVHGHSIFAVSFCSKNGRRYVSGSEERMLRIFEAPSNFQVPGETVNMSNAKDQAASAVVPELGLSNKATFQEPAASEAYIPIPPDADATVNPLAATSVEAVVPLEEELKEKRLWPETAKLYGHANEISCIAADLSNDVLASACKAQNAKDAVIILWDAVTGLECGRLCGHDLTVNQLRFSLGGNRLLSVSRDRSFAIFTKEEGENRFSFKMDCHKKSAHSRLIYSCAWLLEDKFICTGGRDKCLKVFSSKHGDELEVYKEKFECPVSALDALPSGRDHVYILATGFENGLLRVFFVKLTEGKISLAPLFVSDQSRCGSKINQVQWRPRSASVQRDEEEHIAVACEDVSVRILAIPIPTKFS